MTTIHGTRRRYDVDGCRCLPCCEARRAYNEARKKQKQDKQVYLPVEPIWNLFSPEQKSKSYSFYNTYKDKGVPFYQADKWCVKLGFHPWTVYGDLWFESTWRLQSVEG